MHASFLRSTLTWLTFLATSCGAGIAMAQGLSPDEASRKMQVPAGFEAKTIAAEPLVRQPVAIEFDDRGRLWVIQYLQYPNPAGLKRVQVDRYSRTKYDRVPEPPPHGPRGADRITILEDRDGDGVLDAGRDFVQGLNLATGLAFGHGGVFVLNVPYLLFYRDADRDDVPDGDPEVLLSGFGMEDAHSVANSLTFGPDGWLYGCQGSTVTANVRGVEFQQGVWRYHPVTREFELFCEGGGNSWGLDFDRTGRLFYSTNWGGHVLLHAVQGGYFVKSFGKHGALHNPHAYGYFEHAPHRNFRGGHVTVGGIVYQEDAFPASFRGRYIAGDLLGHAVYWHDVESRGGTVRTAHGGELLIANDSWFAPTDVTTGPDGAIYVADWHDARTAHPDPDAAWDRSNGRIVRIAPKSADGANPATKSSAAPKFDLARLEVAELLKLLDHRAQWHVRRARQELVRRGRVGGPVIAAKILEQVREPLRQRANESPDETAALEALWTLYVLGDWDETLARRLLASPHAAVRAWTIRFLGDGRRLSNELAYHLDDFAEQEPALEVRQQLACSAARFPAAQALPMINANINRDLDLDLADPYQPFLWWWAIEKHSVTGREEVLRRFVRPTLWKSRLGRDVLLVRLVRRYAAEGNAAGLDSLVKLLRAAPDDAARRTLWSPIWLGWQEQAREAQQAERLAAVREHEFSKLLLAHWRANPDDATLVSLAIALRHPEPLEAALRDAFDARQPGERRARLLTLLAETGDARLTAPALATLESQAPERVRVAALDVLARIDDPLVAPRLIALYRAAPAAPLNGRIRDVLLARRDSARAWLAAVDRGDVPAGATPLEQIRRVALFEDAELDALVVKHWGRLHGATREEKLAEVRRLNNDLRAAGGDAVAGGALFKKHCAACHALFGEGAKVGPDLTTANRQDRDFLLVSLVDPSSVIRKEYVSVVVQTSGGRVLTGLPIARDAAAITLVDAKGEKLTVATNEIEALRDSPVSLMPEDLYRQFKPQELRDLFAYLQSKR